MKLTIDGLGKRDEMVFERCRRIGLPMAVSMSGGYAPDIEAIVTIHANTIRVAVTLRGTALLAALAPRHAPWHLAYGTNVSTVDRRPRQVAPSDERPDRVDGVVARPILRGRGAAAGSHGADGGPDARLLRLDAGLHPAPGQPRRQARHGVLEQCRAPAAVAPGDDSVAGSRDRRAAGDHGRPLHHRSEDGRRVCGFRPPSGQERTRPRWPSSGPAFRRRATSKRFRTCDRCARFACGRPTRPAATGSPAT